MAKNAKTTAFVIDEVVEPIYKRFGFSQNAHLKKRLIEILEDESLGAISMVDSPHVSSEAAYQVRDELWSSYSGGGASAIATSKLFIALGRKEELTWILGEAGMD